MFLRQTTVSTLRTLANTVGSVLHKSLSLRDEGLPDTRDNSRNEDSQDSHQASCMAEPNAMMMPILAAVLWMSTQGVREPKVGRCREEQV